MNTDTPLASTPVLAQAFDVMHEAALILDEQGRVIALNAAARRLLGRSDSEMLGQPIHAALPELAKLHPDLRSLPNRVQIAVGEAKTAAPYELALAPLFGSAGEPLGRLVTLTALSEGEAQSLALLRAIPDSVLRLTREGQILDFSGRDELGNEIRPESMIGRALEAWLPPQAMALCSRALAQVMASQEPQTFEYAVNAGSQAERHYEARLVSNGRDEAVLMVRDVTERARQEQMRSDFIHRAAHDLRTPLTTASLAASIIQEGGTPEELEQYWKILRNELGRQRELIEELLSLGRIESGTLQLAPTAVELAPIVQEAAESVRPLAEKRSVRLVCTLPPGLPRIAGDKTGLAQVFVNLLDNAVKFSPSGTSVEVEATARPDGISVRVRDHGMGIPPEDLPYLFTRFFRAANAIQNEIQGTGVGLFIAKAIVDQLNGRISVESQPGVGTTFEVWLPRYADKVPS